MRLAQAEQREQAGAQDEQKAERWQRPGPERGFIEPRILVFIPGILEDYNQRIKFMFQDDLSATAGTEEE